MPKSWKSWIEDDDSGRVKLSEAAAMQNDDEQPSYR